MGEKVVPKVEGRGLGRPDSRHSSRKAWIYSFDKYFQLCRSHTQTAVLIVQWMLGPHQGLGDIGQGNISM